MKRAFISTIMLSFMGFASAQSLNFTINGNIKGICKGDTIRLSSVSLPNWKILESVDIILSEDEKFSYSGTHAHTQQYRFTYHPTAEGFNSVSKIAQSILIKDGVINITGERDHIYYSALSGGFYDDDLQRVSALEDSLSIERNKFLLSERTPESVDKFNNFSQDNRQHYIRLQQLHKDYLAGIGNEYAAWKYATDYYSTSLQDLEKQYNSLDVQAHASFYGKYFESVIGNVRRLAQGQPAPDFEIITLKGEKITNKDLAGKYILIYHFGLCPGSMQVDSGIADLYNKYKDKLEVIALTDSFDQLCAIRDDVASKGSTVMGMDLEKVMTLMTNHPWKYDADKTTESNQQIESTFLFGGYPYFVLITPQGTMFARGFHEVLEPIKELLNKD